MANHDKIDLDITILGSDEITLRELGELRSGLCEEMQSNLANDNVDLFQEDASRSLDPAIVGTIGMALLPIVVEKVVDLLVKWGERHNECSVTIKVPTADGNPVEITYNPTKTPPDKLKLWISSAVEAAQLGKA